MTSRPNRRLPRGRAARVALVLLAAVSLSGCVSAVASVGDLVSDAAPRQARDVQIFVASTRPQKAEGTVDGAAHFSLATVSVPPSHEPGGLETASFGSPDRRSDFAIVGRRALDPEAFRNAVATHLSGRVGSNRDVLVFVHGFNTGFDEARFRLAQIVTDGGFNGVPVLFTWPSKGSLFGYGSDREAATASRDALEHMLLDLAAVPDVGRIHVLAHSMGSWLAMEALREVAIAGHPDLDGHLGDIILAAPDIDQGVFRQQVERLGPGAHISVFAATNDRALTLSGILADRPRLGAIDASSPDGRRVLEGLGVHVIDLTRDSVGLIGHATYASAPEVIRGIGAEIGAARSADRDRQAVLGGEPDAPQFEAPSAPVVATPLPVRPAGARPRGAVTVRPHPGRTLDRGRSPSLAALAGASAADNADRRRSHAEGCPCRERRPCRCCVPWRAPGSGAAVGLSDAGLGARKVQAIRQLGMGSSVKLRSERRRGQPASCRSMWALRSLIEPKRCVPLSVSTSMVPSENRT